MRTASAVDMEAATAEWIGRVQASCPDQVLGACPMAPPRNEVAGRAAALGGGVAFGILGRLFTHKAEQAVNRGRAGGLPNTFVLAVTPTKVRVLESRNTRTGVEVVGEHTAWDRSGLKVVNVERGHYKTNVTLRLADGQELVCAAGTHEYTDNFIALLGSPPV